MVSNSPPKKKRACRAWRQPCLFATWVCCTSSVQTRHSFKHSSRFRSFNAGYPRRLNVLAPTSHGDILQCWPWQNQCPLEGWAMGLMECAAPLGSKKGSKRSELPWLSTHLLRSTTHPNWSQPVPTAAEAHHQQPMIQRVTHVDQSYSRFQHNKATRWHG